MPLTTLPDSLKEWISPHYLESPPFFTEESLEEGAVLDDFFLSERLILIERFMNEGAQYRNDCVKLVEGNREVRVTLEEWDLTPNEEKFCFRKIVSGARSGYESDPGFRAYQELREFLVSPSFACFLHNMTRMLCRMANMGAVRMDRKSILVSHDDEIPGRMLNLICYLSRGWKAGFGGELRVSSENGDERLVSPLFGRLVLLKPTSGKSHQVEPLQPAAGEWLRFCFVSRGKDPRFKPPLAGGGYE